MSNADFQQMANAFAKGSRLPTAPEKTFTRVTVLGGGIEGRALASQCLSSGSEVVLFSAYGHELDAMINAGSVTIRGTGPVGTYQFNSSDSSSIKVTSRLDEALHEADVIFVTGPVLKQRTYSMVLASHLSEGQVLVLAASRTFGAQEMAWYLNAGGIAADISIVELQTFPYCLRVQGNVINMDVRSDTYAAVMPATRTSLIDSLSSLIPSLVSVPSVLHSGFGDASGLIDCVALMLGGPSFNESDEPRLPGMEPHPDKAVFRALIGSHHADMIATLANERREVAKRWGVRDLCDDETWLERFAGAASGDNSREIPDGVTARELIRCGVIGSLVPLNSAAQIAGVSVPATDALIQLAQQHIGGDLINAGRRLCSMIPGGVTDLESARRAVEKQVLN